MPHLTVQDMVLFHLSKYRGYRDRKVVPIAITQSGIAEAVGVKRSHISVELKRMREDKDWIEEKKAHAGPRNKKKVYFIRPAGDIRMKEIKEALRKKEIIMEIDGTEQEMRGPDAVEYLTASTGLSYPQLIRDVLKSRRISPEDLKPSAEEGYSTSIPVVDKIYGREKEMKKISVWYKGERPILSVMGPAGIGKTTLCAAFAGSEKSPVFWHTIRGAGRSQAILEAMADFFKKNGMEDASRAVSAGTEDFSGITEAISSIDMNYLIVIDTYKPGNKEIRTLMESLKNGLSSDNAGGKVIVISRAIPDFYTRKDISFDKTVEEMFLRGVSIDEAKRIFKESGRYPGDESMEEIYSISAGAPLLLQMAANARGDGKGRMMAYLMEQFYLRLNTEERDVLARLSVFRQPAPSEAFLSTEKDVEALRGLLHKGMVHYDRDGEYFTHEVISSFFLSRTRMKKEHRSAAAYYRELGEKKAKVEEIYHLICAGDLKKAEKEVMKSLSMLISSGQASPLLDALDAAPDTSMFLSARARARAATKDLKTALEFAKDAVKKADDRHLPYVLWQLGIIQTTMGNHKDAEKTLVKAIELAKDKKERMKIKHSLGVSIFFQHRYAEAERLEREALRYFKENKDREEEIIVKSELALSLARQSRLEDAVSLLQECAEYYEEERLYRNLGNTYNQMAIYESYLDNREDAKRHFEMAALYGDITGDARLAAYALMNSADNYVIMGETEKGVSYALRARKAFQDMRDRGDAAITLNIIAKAHLIRNDGEAEKAYEEAEKALRETGNLRILAEMYKERGEIEQGENRRKSYLKAIDTYKEIGKEGEAEKLRKELEAHET